MLGTLNNHPSHPHSELHQGVYGDVGHSVQQTPNAVNLSPSCIQSPFWTTYASLPPFQLLPSPNPPPGNYHTWERRHGQIDYCKLWSTPSHPLTHPPSFQEHNPCSPAMRNVPRIVCNSQKRVVDFVLQQTSETQNLVVGHLVATLFATQALQQPLWITMKCISQIFLLLCVLKAN